MAWPAAPFCGAASGLAGSIAGWTDAGRIALEKLRGEKLTIPGGASATNMRIEVRSVN